MESLLRRRDEENQVGHFRTDGVLVKQVTPFTREGQNRTFECLGVALCNPEM
jgi:hypothetical protein